MCLIAFAWRAHDRYPLVVVANRDEYYARPTADAQFWMDSPSVLAGRDLEAGGSWFGINRTGCFAALTNYRDPSRQIASAPSRGALVSDFLSGQVSARDYASDVQSRAAAYNGFNLLLCDGSDLVYVGNYLAQPRILKPGVHALSNALLDTPWPKTVAASHSLKHWLSHDDETIESLVSLLQDRTLAPSNALPETGLGQELERKLSAQFIETEGYGTRGSTALLVDVEGAAQFLERRFNPEWGETREQIEGFWPRKIYSD